MNKNLSIKEFQSQQKHIGENYYTFANECENPNLRIDFLAFAREESDIITWLDYEFDENEKAVPDYISQSRKKEAYDSFNEKSVLD